METLCFVGIQTDDGPIEEAHVMNWALGISCVSFCLAISTELQAIIKEIWIFMLVNTTRFGKA